MTACSSLQEQVLAGPAAMRDAGGDHAVGELGPGRDPEAAGR